MQIDNAIHVSWNPRFTGTPYVKNQRPSHQPHPLGKKNAGTRRTEQKLKEQNFPSPHCLKNNSLPRSMMNLWGRNTMPCHEMPFERCALWRETAMIPRLSLGMWTLYLLMSSIIMSCDFWIFMNLTIPASDMMSPVREHFCFLENRQDITTDHRMNVSLDHKWNGPSTITQTRMLHCRRKSSSFLLFLFAFLLRCDRNMPLSSRKMLTPCSNFHAIEGHHTQKRKYVVSESPLTTIPFTAQFNTRRFLDTRLNIHPPASVIEFCGLFIQHRNHQSIKRRSRANVD